MRTDSANEVAESEEGNNLLGAAQPITLSLKPRPDLQVTSMLAPQRVPGGGVIDVEWTVTNLGSAATPTGGSRWTDGVYLSLNSTWDSGDKLLGPLPNGSALEIGEAYHSSGTYQLPPAAAGNVYIIVKTDTAAAVDEYPYEENNAFAWPLAVDVEPVPPPSGSRTTTSWTSSTC